MKRRIKRSQKSNRRYKSTRSFDKLFRVVVILILIGLFLGTIYHYRNGLSHYFSFKTSKILEKDTANKRLQNIRNFQILENHKEKSIGLDVSEYQGKISWSYVDTLDQKHPVDFVFIRATVGKDRKDFQFKRNWAGAKENKMIRGAYHYYRPNENSIEQADFFIRTVTLQKGDLPPVLDIEKLPKNQSLNNLKKGLKKWLNRVEAHYKVHPIIYTSERYYDDFLKNEFKDYLFWIANYNFSQEKIQEDWLFWQFTEKATVPGIKYPVDVNIYNGDLEQLQFITIE